MKNTRRTFLKNTALAATAAGVPTLLTSARARGEDANSKPTVVGIGVGGSRARYSRGGGIANQAGRHGQMIAVCDVDQLHNEQFNKRYGGKLKMYTDYRKLFDEIKPDVVTIGTPDHWHVPIAIRALQAGAHVYCEKPLTLTIEEGFQIRKAVEKAGRVFQVGTQQRSENGGKFLKAIAIAKSGRLGKKVNAYVAIGGAPSGGPFKSTPVPEGLDWDMWLGPAPKADYCEQRRRMFRWWFDYSGGKMTDWGAHHIDIAQWALGQDHSGPVKVSATGQFPSLVPEDLDWRAYLDGKVSLPNGYNTATQFNIELTFADGSLMSVNNHYKREKDNVNFGNGILFEGDKGRIFVNRGKLEGKPIDDMNDADRKEIDELVVKLYHGNKPGSHMGNFFHCIETGDQPVSDVETHVRTMTSCHLCNVALMLGRELNWDPKREQFVGDAEATALMTRDRRKGFEM